jgi:hypothetical protein
VKTAFKRRSFRGVEVINKSVTAKLNAVSLEVFVEYFKKMFKTCNKRIQVGGDYFE